MRIEEKILNSSRTIAVVGLSSKPDRPSYRVARYLRKQGIV
ncbi:MAG: CoA-binding protein [Dehalococcoidia bacterium]|nr:CoA-binding protein [Dehalococcoidia bacterium]MDH4299179.1 CoA-binding protein [Dehalococcoidia bacterium]MDH4367888.1 CoA-binding protein [Dehalococcoidia bacterium]